MLIPCCLASCVLFFGWIGIEDIAGLIAFALLFGFFSGTFVSLPPTTVVSLSPHLGVVGTRMGMTFTVASLGLPIGTPVSGANLNSTGQWIGPQTLAGGTTCVATLFLVAARISKAGTNVSVRA